MLAATSTLTDAIIAYRAKRGDVNFKLQQSAGDADCDISISTVQASELPTPSDTVCCFEESLFLAVSKIGKYGARESVALPELAEESFISLGGTRQLRGICDRLCLQAGFSPSVAFESDNPASVKKLIAARAGVGFWPEFSWGRCEGPDIKVLPITGVDCRRVIVLELHEGKVEKPAARAFFEFLCTFVAARIAAAKA